MIKKLFLVISLLVISFAFQSCGSSKKTQQTRTTTSKSSTLNLKTKPYKKNVVACYYHDKFNGRKTASGEVFSNKKQTAAHKKLPLGTVVKVTNKANGKWVLVKINDRGPFTRGREIDLSKKAFMDITDNPSKGLLDVNIEIVEQ